MIVVDRNTNLVVAGRVRIADTFFGRLRGLLGTASLPEGEGLWITPCDRVHTIGMRYPIDVLFLDGSGRVIGVCHALKPNRCAPRFRGAAGVLELRAGTAAHLAIAVGDDLTLRPGIGGT